MLHESLSSKHIVYPQEHVSHVFKQEDQRQISGRKQVIDDSYNTKTSIPLYFKIQHKEIQGNAGRGQR